MDTTLTLARAMGFITATVRMYGEEIVGNIIGGCNINMTESDITI